MTRTAATYVYCAVQCRTAPRAAGAPRGLPGTKPLRALDAGGGVWLVVADAPLPRYGAEAVERGLRDLEWVSRCAVAHDAVVEHFAARASVIPLKIFTLFGDDDRARAHFAAHRADIERLFARVADRAEWAVHLALDEQRVGARARDAAAGRAASGTAFLLRKKAVHDAVARVVENGPRTADEVFTALGKHADDARRRTPVAGTDARPVLLDAAFLVRRGAARAFRAAVATRAAALAERGYALTLTGPWPPYTFVSEQA